MSDNVPLSRQEEVIQQLKHERRTLFPKRNEAVTNALRRKFKELCDFCNLPQSLRLKNDAIDFQCRNEIIKSVLKLLKDQGSIVRDSRPIKWWNGQKCSPLGKHYIPEIMNHCSNIAMIMSNKYIEYYQNELNGKSLNIENVRQATFEYWRNQLFLTVFCDAKFAAEHTGDNAVIPRGSLKYRKNKLRKLLEEWCDGYQVFETTLNIVNNATKELKKYGKNKAPKQLKDQNELLASKDEWQRILESICESLAKQCDPKILFDSNNNNEKRRMEDDDGGDDDDDEATANSNHSIKTEYNNDNNNNNISQLANAVRGHIMDEFENGYDSEYGEFDYHNGNNNDNNNDNDNNNGFVMFGDTGMDMAMNNEYNNSNNNNNNENENMNRFMFNGNEMTMENIIDVPDLPPSIRRNNAVNNINEMENLLKNQNMKIENLCNELNNLKISLNVKTQECIELHELNNNLILEKENLAKTVVNMQQEHQERVLQLKENLKQLKNELAKQRQNESKMIATGQIQLQQQQQHQQQLQYIPKMEQFSSNVNRPSMHLLQEPMITSTSRIRLPMLSQGLSPQPQINNNNTNNTNNNKNSDNKKNSGYGPQRGFSYSNANEENMGGYAPPFQNTRTRMNSNNNVNNIYNADNNNNNNNNNHSSSVGRNGSQLNLNHFINNNNNSVNGNDNYSVISRISGANSYQSGMSNHTNNNNNGNSMWGFGSNMSEITTCMSSSKDCSQSQFDNNNDTNGENRYFISSPTPLHFENFDKLSLNLAPSGNDNVNNNFDISSFANGVEMPSVFVEASIPLSRVDSTNDNATIVSTNPFSFNSIATGFDMNSNCGNNNNNINNNNNQDGGNGSRSTFVNNMPNRSWIG